MSTADHYERYAGSAPENYQKLFVPVISAPLAVDLLQIAALKPGERVLDVACGTGHVTRLARERVGPRGSVVGLDPNPGMLAAARAATPPTQSIDWHQASAEKMPLSDGAFDAVLCQLGLQFVPDKAAALSEMRRLLTSAGRLVLSVVGPMPALFASLAEALSRHVNAQSSGFMRAVFSLHDPEQLRRLLRDAAFQEIEIQSRPALLELPPAEEFLWQYVQSTPLSGQVAEVTDAQRTALAQDVIRAWQPFATRSGMQSPLDVVLVRARA